MEKWEASDTVVLIGKSQCQHHSIAFKYSEYSAAELGSAFHRMFSFGLHSIKQNKSCRNLMINMIGSTRIVHTKLV